MTHAKQNDTHAHTHSKAVLALTKGDPQLTEFANLAVGLSPEARQSLTDVFFHILEAGNMSTRTRAASRAEVIAKAKHRKLPALVIRHMRKMIREGEQWPNKAR